MTLLTVARRRWDFPAPGGDFFTLGSGKSLDLSGNVNLVVDGNSIMTAAYSAVGAFDDSLRLLDPLASTVDTSTSVAISGQDWSNMTSNHADTDAAWVEGATNILFLGETRNQIVTDGSSTTAALVANCQAAIEGYLDAIRAVHPGWAVIIGGTLPSGGENITRYQIENEAFVAVDAWLHANVDTLDLHAVVGFRNHPAFDHDGLAPEPFQAYPAFWRESSPRWTHPKDPGKLVMAQNVNSVVGMLSV